MSVWAVILFISLAQSSDIAENETTVLFCRHPAKPATLTAKFPELFSVAIDAVYYANESTPRISDVLEIVDQKRSLSTITRFENGISYQFIFNQTSKTYAFVNDSTTCTDGLQFRPSFPSSNDSQNDPLLFPKNTTAGWLNNISSIIDVWSWANSNTSEIYKDDDAHTMHEHGVPIEHYFVCKQGLGGYVFQIEICVTAQDVKMPFSGLKGLPVRIDIKRFYNGTTIGNTTTNAEEFIGYRLSNYKSISENADREAFMPPVGVPCANVSTKDRPAVPELTETFSVHIDYLDEANRLVGVSQLHVNVDRHYLAFQYSQNETGLPLTARTDLPRGKIVHDFYFGIEYAVDTIKDTCVNVSDIPNDAGDAKLSEEGGQRSMILKNASELLGLYLDNATVYYVGERILDNEIPADVWIAYAQVSETAGKQTRNRTVVHEVYFSKPDWKLYTSVGTAPKVTLLAVKTYHWLASDEPKAPPTKQTLRFHDLTTYDNFGPQLRLFDVSPCLNISKNDSYLVAYGNDTLANVDKIGRGRVENSLRLAIANEAKISPLRVTNFYFEAVNDTFWVFFFIADRPKVNGTKTKWHEKDPITANEASANLNKTMEANGISVFVPNEDGVRYFVALKKGSLAAVPPLFAPPIIHNDIKSGGYTGGSMAALGICMLLIGGVVGMVLAFFMWKRNRGIAYQIYE